MVSKAIARFARLSPRKARVVVDLVRGRQAGEALQLLEFTTKAGAPVLKKVIESAVANARTQQPGVDLDALFVETAFQDTVVCRFDHDSIRVSRHVNVNSGPLSHPELIGRAVAA